MKIKFKNGSIIENIKTLNESTKSVIKSFEIPKGTDRHIREFYLRCDDLGEMLVVDKFSDGYWNFSIQDSYINGDNSLWQRVKRAFKVLFGKPVYYAGICISGDEKIIEFRDQLTKAIENKIEWEN